MESENSGLAPPPWRGRGIAIFRDLPEFTYLGLGTSILLAGFASNSATFAIIGLVSFVLLGATAVLSGLSQLEKRKADSFDRRSTVAVIGVVVGSVAIFVAWLLSALMFTLPWRLILFGLCSGDPEAFLCVD